MTMPPEIIWNDSLNVGHEKIDCEHRRFVEIINTLNLVISNGVSQVELMCIFMELYRYINCHMAGEEQLMRSVCYEKTEEHIQEHQKFIKQLDDFSMIFNSGHVSVCTKMLDWMTEWFIGHISVTDKQLAACLVKK